MLTLTWQEFDGLSVYVNSVRLLCQQAFEYYAPNEMLFPTSLKAGPNKNDNKYNKRSQANSTTSSPNMTSMPPQNLGSTLFIGINNKVVLKSIQVFYYYKNHNRNVNDFRNTLGSIEFEKTLLEFRR